MTHVNTDLMQKIDEINSMAQHIVAAKTVAAPICERMTTLTARATTVARHCLLQKEYADAVLDMCITGNMDKRRAEIILPIIAVVESYPAVRQSRPLKAKLEKARAKCRQHLQGTVTNQITW
jgi:hypothetical protein